MIQRSGMNSRLLDGDRFTVSIGSWYISSGSHNRPVVRIIDRKRAHRGPLWEVSIPLPHVRFRRCYKLRHIGGLRWYGFWHRQMRKLCQPPRGAV